MELKCSACSPPTRSRYSDETSLSRTLVLEFTHPHLFWPFLFKKKKDERKEREEHTRRSEGRMTEHG